MTKKKYYVRYQETHCWHDQIEADSQDEAMKIAVFRNTPEMRNKMVYCLSPACVEDVKEDCLTERKLTQDKYVLNYYRCLMNYLMGWWKNDCE